MMMWGGPNFTGFHMICQFSRHRALNVLRSAVVMQYSSMTWTWRRAWGFLIYYQCTCELLRLYHFLHLFHFIMPLGVQKNDLLILVFLRSTLIILSQIFIQIQFRKNTSNFKDGINFVQILSEIVWGKNQIKTFLLYQGFLSLSMYTNL